jgi:hypothetical protein
MKANDMLNQVKELLGMEVEAEKVELAQMKLENGTVLEAEAFEADNEVFIVTEDEKVAVPVGEYELEDGKILVVTEEGIIAEIKDAEAEDEEEVSEEEVEAAEEEEVEAKYVTKEELAEVVSMIEEIKAMIEPKEEMSADDMGNLLTEELAAQEKTELSEEPVQKVSHSPEASVEKKMNLFATKRGFSTIDRVFNNLNK